MTSFNIYRVRFIQSQRYAINISAPSTELAEFFAEEIRKRAGTGPFEAIGDPFSGDWQSEEICSANTLDLLAAVANALDQLRRGGPRWTIEESSGQRPRPRQGASQCVMTSVSLGGGRALRRVVLRRRLPRSGASAAALFPWRPPLRGWSSANVVEFY